MKHFEYNAEFWTRLNNIHTCAMLFEQRGRYTQNVTGGHSWVSHILIG